MEDTTPTLITALHTVIADLDKEMSDAPNRELADITNFLQARVEWLEADNA